MRNIFFLLIAVLSLQACSDDKEENWVSDSLAVAVSGDLVSNGESFGVGDGNWGVNVAPDFEGTFKLDIQTDQTWSLSVDYITVDDEEWITPSATTGTGKTSVDVRIDANIVPEYRKASIVITTQGEIPVNKKITVIQKNLGVLNIIWDRKFLLTDNEMVFGPNKREGVIIGTCDSEGDEVALYSSKDWADIRVENGNILLDILANNNAEDFQEATLSLTNLNGGVNRQINIKQYSKETFGAKELWSITANNNNTQSQTGNEVEKLIDGEDNTYWERQWGDKGTGGAGGQKNTKFPYEFLIDFEEAQLINTVDILQRLDWHSGCVKTIQLQFSNDNADWTNGGTYTLATSKDECSAKKDAYSLSLAGTYQARYMKLILLANVWGSAQDAALAELNVYLK